MPLILQNIVLFQLGWFTCVLAGASSYSIYALPAVLAIILIHLYRAYHPAYEVSLILVTLFIGTAWDSALTLAGLFEFSNGVFMQGIAPHWLMAMWALFATTLNVSLNWFKGRLMFSILFGAIGGAAAYYAGNRLGAVQFNNAALTLTIVAIGWAFIFPLLVWLSTVYNGYDKSLRSRNQPAHEGSAS